jgi:hypothetical protein
MCKVSPKCSNRSHHAPAPHRAKNKPASAGLEERLAIAGLGVVVPSGNSTDSGCS